MPVSSHLGDSEETQESSSKRSAIGETIKVLIVEFRILESKEGEEDGNNVISTVRRVDLSKKAFLKHIRYLNSCEEVYRSFVKKILLTIGFRKELC